MDGGAVTESSPDLYGIVTFAPENSRCLLRGAQNTGVPLECTNLTVTHRARGPNMIRTFAVVATTSILLLTGCGGGGDVNVSPSTVDNSVNDSNNNVEGGGNDGSSNPCASYVTDSGQTRQGSYDGTNCSYAPSFVDSGNNLMYDLDIPALPDGGAHIFEGSLFVGGAANTDQELQDLGVSQGGDGPTLTIEAGATLAWQSNSEFMVINRGSQIIAVGRPDAPITLTSVSDINGDLDNDPEAVSQWGGMVINGFGVSNKCSYTGTRGVDLALDAECHIASEGSAGQDENFYGGVNDDDSSGRLEYFRVKHTGAQVGNGDELNGITFSGVGRNTVVRNIQVYSTFDDGIEMFGGAVEVDTYAGVYVRDDSIDVDEGWIGSVSNALVIQSETDGNHCIESDGLGSFSSLDSNVVEDYIARGLHTQGRVSNLTCLISANGADSGTHGQGAGWRIREGIAWDIRDSMVVTMGPDNPDDTNYCVRIDNRSQQTAEDGDITMDGVVLSCVDRTNGQSLPNGTTVEDFVAGQNAIFADINGATDPTGSGADSELQLLEGTPPIFSIAADTMVVNDAGLPFGASSGDFIGVLSQSEDNPFTGWTFGIFDGSRNQPLWFE